MHSRDRIVQLNFDNHEVKNRITSSTSSYYSNVIKLELDHLSADKPVFLFFFFLSEPFVSGPLLCQQSGLTEINDKAVTRLFRANVCLNTVQHR